MKENTLILCEAFTSVFITVYGVINLQPILTVLGIIAACFTIVDRFISIRKNIKK